MIALLAISSLYGIKGLVGQPFSALSLLLWLVELWQLAILAILVQWWLASRWGMDEGDRDNHQSPQHQSANGAKQV